MYLKYIQIVNFRNLLSAKFQFDEGANTIIGENDAGKSNAITAMRILLDSSYYYNVKRLRMEACNDTAAVVPVHENRKLYQFTTMN